MARVDKSFKLEGKIYIDGIFVGNVTECTISHNENVEKQKDYTGAGGTRAVFREIDSAELNVTFGELQQENLALAVFGDNTAVTAGAVTDEAQTTPADISECPLVLTDNVIDTAQSVTVTGSGGTPTYVANTDYEVEQSGAGITILDTGSIGASTAIEIDYTKVALDSIQALTQSAKEYQVVCAMINRAKSNAPVVVTAHKAVFGPAEALDLITDSFGNLTVTAELTADATKGAGESKYYWIKSKAA